MPGYVVSAPALSDLQEIWEFIAADSPAAASRVQEEFFEAFESLARGPHMGHLRPDLADDSLRFWKLYSYLIVYRHSAKPLEIVRVLHAARDIRKIIGPSGPNPVRKRRGGI